MRVKPEGWKRCRGQVRGWAAAAATGRRWGRPGGEAEGPEGEARGAVSGANRLGLIPARKRTSGLGKTRIGVDFSGNPAAGVCCQYIKRSSDLRQKCCYAANTVEPHMFRIFVFFFFFFPFPPC